MLAFVPIYGTKDAGRGLWRRIRKVLISSGFKENFVMNALYSYAVNGIVEAVVATHVDDLIYAYSPKAETQMAAVKKELIFGTEEELEFRFCGTEIKQDPETFQIKVTCEQTSRKLGTIRLSAERIKQVDSAVVPDERDQLMSVVGSLMWISRCCRPGIAYNVSKLQSVVRNALVSDIVLANKIVKHVQEDPCAGITFGPGLRWPAAEGDAPLCIAAVSDASHGNEQVYLDAWEVREPFRSQGGKLIFLTHSDIKHADIATVHLVSYSSTVQKRVVNSTIKAETYQLTDVVEAADLLRATLADMHGALNHLEWERSAAAWSTSVWFTDCRSCYDTLQKPIAKTVDKRLGIELAALRQSLWRQSGDVAPDRRSLEDKPPQPTDFIRWVDTEVMAADCLTKSMKETYLMEVLDTNTWNFEQTLLAKSIKLKKQQQRRKTEFVEDDEVAKQP